MGVAKQRTICGIDQRIATAEDGERGERVEAGGGVGQTGVSVGDGRGGEAVQGLPGGFQAAAGESEADGWVLPFEAAGDPGDPGGWRAQAAAYGRFQAVAEVIEALVPAPDEGLQLGLDLWNRYPGKTLAAEDDLVADGAVGAGFERGDALLDAMLGGGDEFGGSGGGRRAQVGDEVGDGEVGLVPNRRDDREFGCRDGAGEGFVVEACEVLDRPATPGNENQVRLLGMLVKESDAGCDGARALGALHQRGIDQQVKPSVAAADDFDDVVQNGTGGRGHDADATGEGGQRALAGGIEEAFSFELVAELFKRKLESARASRLDGFCDQLKLAARFIDRDASADEDGEAILRPEAEELGLAAKKDDRKLGVAVLQGEVNVAGGRGAAVGDFAGDPEVGIGLLDMLANVGDEVEDGPDAALRQDGRRFRGDSNDRFRGCRRRREEQPKLAFLRGR